MEHKLKPPNWLTSTLLGKAICKDKKKKLVLTSSVDEAGSRMIRANIDAFNTHVFLCGSVVEHCVS